ncbi:MAG TPA: tetratricopeptide repeat protein [Tepidisphaeraceae bacterium]|nr:tetratricopeptide repeat protein [Tepidisphaeraceae bacterium]
MSIRPKTIRRVILLTVICLLSTGAGWGLYLRNEHGKQIRAEAERVAGLEAYDAGDHAAALPLLHRYLNRVNDDREALLAYATARARVESPGGRHLADAIGVLTNRLLAQHPDDLDAQQLLLQLYVEAYRNDLAVALADRLIQKRPDDPEILKARAIALSRTDRVDAALQAALAYIAIVPLDAREQLRTLWLMDRNRLSPKAMIEHAAKLLADHPDDPRAELVLAVAHGYGSDHRTALDLLRRAAARPGLDPQTVREIVAKFDSLKRFDESRALLERAAETSNDSRLRRIYAERLWQEGRHDALVERFGRFDRADPAVDSSILAFRSLSLAALGRRAEAQLDFTAVQARPDNAAKAWAAALTGLFADPPLAPRDVLDKLRSALSRERDNGLFRAWMGDAYWRLGESELAAQAWQEAADLLPGWADPAARISQVQLANDRVDEALNWALEAYRRSPSLDSAINLVVVRFRKLETSPQSIRAEELLQQVSAVQAAMPYEPRTLPIQVALLARTGQREQAIALVREALSFNPAPDAMTLLQLANVSRAEQLGLQQQIYDAAGPTHRSPMLVLGQAGDLAASGKVDEGLTLLRGAADRAGGGVRWDMAIAQYLEHAAHPDAASAWIALGDRYAGDLEVQRLILAEAQSARADRDFQARTIDRLRELTGEYGQQWRLERAKWLLANRRYEDSAAAVSLLTEIVQRGMIQPRIYLARALEQTGNVSTAIEHLKTASDRDPRDPRPVLELARILRDRGTLDDVRRYLVRLARDGVLSNEDRLAVASLLVDLGEPQRAIDLLAGAELNGANDPAGRVLLADLYRRRGQYNLAEPLFDALLGAPEPSAAAILSAAEFYAATQRPDHAQRVLDRLSSDRFSELTRALTLGRFHERRGDIEQARALYMKACALTPPSAGAWQRRAEFEMSLEAWADAIAVIDEAARLGMNEPRMATLRIEAQAMQLLAGSNGSLEPLARLLEEDPGRRPQAELVRVLADARRDNLDSGSIADRLLPLARRYPRLLALQQHLALHQLRAGRTDDALTTAMRAVDALPGSADAAELAVRVARSTARWPEMRRAAEAWRARISTSPVPADAAIVEALLNLNLTNEAMPIIEGHLAALRADRSFGAALRPVAAHVLARMGRHADARTILEDTLDIPTCRDAWIDCALLSENLAAAGDQLELLTPAGNNLDRSLRLSLAIAWARLADRFGDETSLQRATALLEPLAAQDDAVILLRLGQLRLRDGRLDDAERFLRRSAELDPANADTLNNLAYVLLRANQSLTEAKQFAEQAIALRGNVAAYHDTLARLLVALSDPEAAQRSFDRAIQLDPRCLDAWVGLATLYQHAGRSTDAAAVMQKIEPLLITTPEPAEPVRSELRTLRDALSRTTE